MNQIDCNDWTETLRQKSPLEFTEADALSLPRDRVLIELDEDKPSDVLWTPPNEDESISGRVVRLGLEPLNKMGRPVPHDCAEGDRVLISKHAGVKVKWNGKPALMLRETEVLAVVG